MSPAPLALRRRSRLPALPTRGLRSRRTLDSRDEPTRLALWLPITAIVPLLAPFALILLPLLYALPRRRLPDPPRLFWRLAGLLLSLGGTSVEIQSPRAHVRIHLV